MSFQNLKNRYSNSGRIEFHFLNGFNQEIGRSAQNGSTTWREIIEWFDIAYPTLDRDSYNIHPCTEEGDPNDPLDNHGDAIDLAGEFETLVERGMWFIILGLKGEVITIQINTETPLLRLLSPGLPPKDPRQAFFTEKVKFRDRRCVLTGLSPSPDWPDDYDIFEACHIFPVEQQDEKWMKGSWNQLITDHRPAKDIGESKIYSPQNGIFISLNLVKKFNKYEMAINPKNGYKITCFRGDVQGSEVDGKIAQLNHTCDEEDKVLDALLYHHFRQSVLANMQGRTIDNEFLDFDGFKDMGELDMDLKTKVAMELYIAKATAS